MNEQGIYFAWAMARLRAWIGFDFFCFCLQDRTRRDREIASELAIKRFFFMEINLLACLLACFRIDVAGNWNLGNALGTNWTSSSSSSSYGRTHL